MIPEAAIAMLACARIGAIHSVVFGGFSSESLAHRINDSSCKDSDYIQYLSPWRQDDGLKDIADEALVRSPSIEKVLVVRHTEAPC